MDTDLRELIANVYRACGQRIIGKGVWLSVETLNGTFEYSTEIGLDAFVRDIVPALDAKELEVTIWRRNLKWQVDISEIPTGMVLFATARYDSPVEACFRAAYEALKDD